MTEQIEPCAHCGGEWAWRDYPGGAVGLECMSCGCGTGIRQSPQQAMTVWNRRAIPGDPAKAARRAMAQELRTIGETRHSYEDGYLAMMARIETEATDAT